MLHKGSLSRWDRLKRPLLSSKEFQPCIIHTRNSAGPIVHYNHKFLWSSSPTVGGYLLSYLKTLDATLHTFHVCQADFLPLPRNADTTSQPVKAWKKRIPLVFSGPITETVMYWNPFQVSSLTKGNPQLLQAKFLQGWQNRYYCYYYNICVICLDHDGLVAFHYCMPSMYKYMWQTQVENKHYSTVSGLIRLVIISLECFIEITSDFLCPFMND